jgi:hypothetical protein
MRASFSVSILSAGVLKCNGELQGRDVRCIGWIRGLVWSSSFARAVTSSTDLHPLEVLARSNHLLFASAAAGRSRVWESLDDLQSLG